MRAGASRGRLSCVMRGEADHRAAAFGRVLHCSRVVHPSMCEGFVNLSKKKGIVENWAKYGRRTRPQSYVSQRARLRGRVLWRRRVGYRDAEEKRTRRSRSCYRSVTTRKITEGLNRQEERIANESQLHVLGSREGQDVKPVKFVYNPAGAPAVASTVVRYLVEPTLTVVLAVRGSAAPAQLA